MQICYLEKNAQLQGKKGLMNLSVTKSKLNRNVGEPSRLLRPNEELNKNKNLTVKTMKTVKTVKTR